MAAPMDVKVAVSVDGFIVPVGPPKAFYIPDFITEDEERFLLRNVYAAPKPKWHQLSHRRLQNWGGLPHPNGMIVEDLPGWLKKYVDRVTDLQVFADKNPNHVLVNEYLPGQGIMVRSAGTYMSQIKLQTTLRDFFSVTFADDKAHTDGPLFHPVITTINLGSHAVLNLYEDEEVGSRRRRFVGSLFLRPRSLLVLQEDLYTGCKHEIEEIHEDVIDDASIVLNAGASAVHTGDRYERGIRVSVTIRHVPKTLKMKFR